MAQGCEHNLETVLTGANDDVHRNRFFDLVETKQFTRTISLPPFLQFMQRRFRMMLLNAMRNISHSTHRIRSDYQECDKLCLLFALLACNFTIVAKTPTLFAQDTAEISHAGDHIDNREIVSFDRLPPNARFRVGTTRFLSDSSVMDLVISPDGKSIVTMGNRLEAWNAVTGELLWSADPEQHKARQATAAYGGKCIAFSDEGRWVCTPGSVNEFIAWEVSTGNPRIVRQSEGFEHTFPFSDPDPPEIDPYTPKFIDVSSNGAFVALCSAYGVVVSDAEGSVLAKFENRPAASNVSGVDRLSYPGHYCAAYFSPDNKFLAVVMSDLPSTLLIIDTNKWEEVNAIDLVSPVIRLDFSKDGTRVFSTEKDTTVRAYETTSSKMIWERKIELHDKYVNYLSRIKVSPDNKVLAVCATDDQIYLSDTASGKEINKLHGHRWYPWGIDYSPDSQLLYSAGYDKIIRRWKVSTGEMIDLQDGIHVTDICATSPLTNQIAVATDAGNVFLLDGSDCKVRKILEIDPSELKLSSDGKQLAASGRIDDRLWLSVWNTSTFQRTSHWEWPRGPDLNTTVEKIAFNASGTKIACSVFRQSKAYLWSLESNLLISELKHRDVHGLSFSPTDERLVTGGWDSNLRFWNTENGVAIDSINLEPSFGQNVQISHVQFSPNGDFVAAGHSILVSVWDARDLSLRNQFQYHAHGGWNGGDLNFSPDGLWLCTGESSKIVKVWEPFSGKLVSELGQHRSGLSTVEFGSNGSTLLSCDDSGGCYLWDIVGLVIPNSDDVNNLWKDLSSNDAPSAFAAYWEMSKRGNESVEIIWQNLTQVNQVLDEHEMLKDVEPDKLATRAALMNKVFDSNPQLIRTVAVHRALSLLDRIDTDRSRSVIKELAGGQEVAKYIKAEAVRILGRRSVQATLSPE
jgi:WD40 repeat protein